MKRLLIIFILLCLSLIAFSQSSPTSIVRVPNASTQFGVAIPIGTTVQNLSTGEKWTAINSVAATVTLTTAISSFEPFVTITTTAPLVTDGTPNPTLSINAATTSSAGSMSSSDKTKLDGIETGAEVNVNADWNASSGDAEI